MAETKLVFHLLNVSLSSYYSFLSYMYFLVVFLLKLIALAGCWLIVTMRSKLQLYLMPTFDTTICIVNIKCLKIVFRVYDQF